MNKTGFTAFRLGIAGYLIPFLVIYWPGLMMVGEWGEILLALIISIVMILAAAFGLELLGYLHRRIRGRPGLAPKDESDTSDGFGT